MMNALFRSTKSWLLAGGLAGAVVALLLFLELFDPWRSTLLWREVFNFGHVPLFGVAGVLLLMLTRTTLGGRLSAPLQYAVALTVAVFLAALSEAVQIEGPRDADFLDFLSDVVGVVGFLLMYVADDKVVRSVISALSIRKNRQLLRLGGIAIIVMSAFPLIRTATAWLNRNSAYPVLFSFEQGWEQTFIHTDHATATVVIQVNIGATESDNQVLRVDYRAETYTGLILQDLYPDWSGSNSLTFTATLLSAQPEQVMLRVEDVLTKMSTHDRFEHVLELKPGLNEFNIPLSQIERSQLGRLLDTKRIKRIVLFSASNPRQEFSVEFDDFQLK